MATDPQINPAPMAGSKDKNAISTPHSSAPCTPRIQNITPPSAPCVAATTMLPLTVARITVMNLSSNCRLCTLLREKTRRRRAGGGAPARGGGGGGGGGGAGRAGEAK